MVEACFAAAFGEEFLALAEDAGGELGGGLGGGGFFFGCWGGRNGEGHQVVGVVGTGGRARGDEALEFTNCFHLRGLR